MKRSTKRFKKVNWKYVLSELPLIVLGILIALYINNLNERRKENNFEKKITAEIGKSLQSDIEGHIKNRIDRAERIIASSEIVLDHLHGNIKYHDSLETHFWRMNWIIIFEPQAIPFERLKTKGIETLSNEKLRVRLLELYDYTYPQISFFVQDYNNWTTNRIESYSLSNFEIIKYNRAKGYKPIDRPKLISDFEYKNLVLEKKSRTESLLDRMKLANKKVEGILEIINDQ